MMTALYILSLGLASGVTALWGRRMLADLGLVHGFEPSLWTCACIAALYVASQCAFRGVLMLLKPTRAHSFSNTEFFSQIVALLLLPSLLGITIPIPYATLQRVEPLFHLGAFIGMHGFFKLMAFFAAVQGMRASRFRALPWLAYTGAAILLLTFSGMQYLDAVHEEYPVIVGERTPFVAGNMYAVAAHAPRTARVLLDVPQGAGDYYSFFVTPHPDENRFPDEIYVRIAPYDQSTATIASKAITQSVQALQNEWTEFRIDPGFFPDDSKRIAFSWSVEAPDSLKQRFGIQAENGGDEVLLVSGPWRHTRTSETPPRGIVLVVVEGLGAENMSIYGYARNTTPQLAERADSLLRFEEVYTPTPEATGACMSLLTGLNPLAHGYYESHAGPLPEHVWSFAEIARTSGYLTVAFTEGRGLDKTDLTHDSEFSRGFILFDDHFPIEMRATRAGSNTEPALPSPAGARVTLLKAATWIHEHANTQYFALIRLRELRTPQYWQRYGEGFVGRGRTPTPLDVYDTAVAYMDRQLSAFLDEMENMPDGPSPVVMITSTHGFDFSEPGRGAWRRGGPARRSLNESSLRIPLLLRAPGHNSANLSAPASLMDVLPTLAYLAGTPVPKPISGVNILRNNSIRPCISLMGDPVALSMRSGRWRFTWQSGQSPYTFERLENPVILEFVDVARYRSDLAPQDNIRREPLLVEAFQNQLLTFFNAYKTTEPSL